jgi:hypothetical protein
MAARVVSQFAGRWTRITLAALASILPHAIQPAAGSEPVSFDVQADVVLKQFDPKYWWFHPRVAPIPGHGKNDGKRAGGPRLKTSLNAYSFNKMLSDHLKGTGKGMSLFELLDFCAEHDFDAIDPTGYYFPGYPKPPSDAYLNEFKRRAFVRGLDISGTGVRTHFASADKAKRESDVQLVKDWVEVAARMGAPVLRVFAGAPSGRAHLGSSCRLDGGRPEKVRRARQKAGRHHRYSEP